MSDVVAGASGALGTVTVLVNPAGIGLDPPGLEMSPAQCAAHLLDVVGTRDGRGTVS